MMSLAERHADEIAHHAGSKWTHPTWTVDESMIPWNMKEYRLVLDRFYPGKDGMKDLTVLECGCGMGVMSIMIAKRGARVRAFDLSPERVAIARELASRNGVADCVEFRHCPMEEMAYPNGSFDLVLGTRVLHHVEIGLVAPRIFNLLKPGGRALFWEPTERNPVLVALRWLYRRIPGVPHVGSGFEHPLTRAEIRALADAFRGNMHLLGTPVFFFSHIARVTGIGRRRPFRAMAQFADMLFDRATPFLRRYNLQQIIVLRKE